MVGELGLVAYCFQRERGGERFERGGRDGDADHRPVAFPLGRRLEVNERVRLANPAGLDNAARLASNTAVRTLGLERELHRLWPRLIRGEDPSRGDAAVTQRTLYSKGNHATFAWLKAGSSEESPHPNWSPLNETCMAEQIVITLRAEASPAFCLTEPAL